MDDVTLDPGASGPDGEVLTGPDGEMLVALSPEQIERRRLLELERSERAAKQAQFGKIPTVIVDDIHIVYKIYGAGVGKGSATSALSRIVSRRTSPALIFNDLVRYALMTTVPASILPPHVWLITAGWAFAFGLGGYVFFWRSEEEYGRG